MLIWCLHSNEHSNKKKTSTSYGTEATTFTVRNNDQLKDYNQPRGVSN